MPNICFIPKTNILLFHIKLQKKNEVLKKLLLFLIKPQLQIRHEIGGFKLAQNHLLCEAVSFWSS